MCANCQSLQDLHCCDLWCCVHWPAVCGCPQLHQGPSCCQPYCGHPQSHPSDRQLFSRGGEARKGDTSHHYAIRIVPKFPHALHPLLCHTLPLFLPQTQGEVELSEVHFSYPTRPEVEVLKGLSLNVQQGQTLALVGPVGVARVQWCL